MKSLELGHSFRSHHLVGFVTPGVQKLFRPSLRLRQWVLFGRAPGRIDEISQNSEIQCLAEALHLPVLSSITTIPELPLE